MEKEEITPEWVKENLCMDDGNDITYTQCQPFGFY